MPRAGGSRFSPSLLPVRVIDVTVSGMTSYARHDDERRWEVPLTKRSDVFHAPFDRSPSSRLRMTPNAHTQGFAKNCSGKLLVNKNHAISSADGVNSAPGTFPLAEASAEFVWRSKSNREYLSASPLQDVSAVLLLAFAL